MTLVAAEVCDDGAVVEYSCEHGFSFSGDFNNKTSECVEGVWTGAPLHGCTGIQFLIAVLCSSLKTNWIHASDHANLHVIVLKLG